MNDGIRVDAKFFSLLIFMATQLGIAVWWAGEKTTEIEHLRRDMDKLTTRMDKQLDRMEIKLDNLRAAAAK